MDPQQQQQQAANLLAGMGVGAIMFFFIFALACVVFSVWLFWRIFNKAGLAGPLSLLLLVPGIGILIVVCVLAFSRWNVVPVPPGYASGPPSYPPPAYPPSSYPPTGTTQL